MNPYPWPTKSSRDHPTELPQMRRWKDGVHTCPRLAFRRISYILME